MGEHRPEVGEHVRYYVTAERSCVALVIHVEYWDCVDLQLLDDGSVVRGVRRVLADSVHGFDGWPDARVGRFQRLPGAK